MRVLSASLTVEWPSKYCRPLHASMAHTLTRFRVFTEWCMDYKCLRTRKPFCPASLFVCLCSYEIWFTRQICVIYLCFFLYSSSVRVVPLLFHEHTHTPAHKHHIYTQIKLGPVVDGTTWKTHQTNNNIIILTQYNILYIFAIMAHPFSFSKYTEKWNDAWLWL